MTTSEDCSVAVATMESFCVALEARSPARRCLRAYEIEVITYGRIGAPGRTKVRSFQTDIEAAEQVRTCLRRRASAPRRVGVAYQVLRMARGKAWYQPDLDQQLHSWFSTTAGSLPDRIDTVPRIGDVGVRGRAQSPRAVNEMSGSQTGGG
jgi:hypothetical protein